jgi:pilus assembly protein CpaC
MKMKTAITQFIRVTALMASFFALFTVKGDLGVNLSLAADASPPSATSPDGKADAKKKKKYKRSRLTNDESEGEADKRHLLLSTGEDKAIDLDFDVNDYNKDVVVGNPQVVAGTLVKIGDKRQLVLKPLKSGDTTVTIRGDDGVIQLILDVRVSGSNLLRIAGELRDLLRDIEGLEVRVIGSKVVMEGELLVPGDYGRLLTVATDKAYSDFVINLTTLSPLALQVLARKMQDDFAAFAPNVKTRVVNGTIFLEGTVDNRDQADHAARVATLYLPELRPPQLIEKDPNVIRLTTPRSLIQNFIVVNPAPPKKQEKLVRITVYFVELSKEYSNVFGFKWEPGFTADPSISIGTNPTTGQSGSTGLSFSGTISSLLPKLQSAQDAGYARILKQGTLIVRSGQPAKLTESEDYTFNSVGPNGQLISQAKPVGLSVAVTPSILGQSEDIQMDLDMDQSNVVGRQTSSGAPPVTASHKVTTKLYVKNGESAAVAGVISGTVGTDFNKDAPGTGSTFTQGTDPLFTLEHSKAYRKQKSQFVIFVTPQIVENASDGTEDLKKNFRVRVK